MIMKIAYQGEPGAYSEAAALRFSPNASTVPCESFEDVFAAVQGGKTSHGILPIENSIGGSIHRNYDLLLEHELPVVSEVLLQVSHNLLAFPGTTLADIKKVYSHPQGLAQCEGFLSSLKGVEIVATYDTAGSAKMIRDKELKDAAAIASARAAEVFNLESLAAGIQDFKENITRFIVISKGAADPETADKTMIVFTLPNTPGALFKALSVFALRDIDLTKLESRPVRGRAFEYLFYADIAVPRQDLQCTRALVHLAEFAKSMRTLGSYSSWKEKQIEQSVETQKRRDHRRSQPRARARDVEGGRLLRCRFAQADHRRREHVDRDRPVQLPPAHARRAREGRHPQGRRHADGVQHRVDLRRHHDGQPGHEDVAHQPRSHRRFDRAGRARQPVRRAHRAVRLRQDDSGHHHGARAPRHPGRDALRRVHRARRVPRQKHHHSGRVRGRGRARRRPHVGCRSSQRREPGMPWRRRVRRPVHREYDVDRRRVSRHLGDGLQRRARARSRKSRASDARRARWSWIC